MASSNYTLERDIERGLVNLIRDRGGLCLKWVCPGWAGVPDRICLLPGGRIMFVELKRPKGGQVAERQKWFIERLTGLGFECWICRNQQDLDWIRRLIDAGARRACV